jgi:hypothetical protein
LDFSVSMERDGFLQMQNSKVTTVAREILPSRPSLTAQDPGAARWL